MHLLDSMNRKALGLGFGAYLLLFVLGLLIVGLDPSDTELQLVFVFAAIAGFIVSGVVMWRGWHEPDK